MAFRTRDLLSRHGLTTGSRYHWDLAAGEIRFGEVAFGLTAVGTVSGDSFMWAWANESIPDGSKKGIERVQQFGQENDLGLLLTPCAAGGLAQAKECLAIAGRVLDASGVWIDRTEDGYIVFLLHDRS